MKTVKPDAPAKRKRKNRTRLPNGFGSVVYLGAKRRRPYMARKTVGFDPDSGHPLYKILGYYETWIEGFEALSEYNRNPYDIDARKMTFADVHDAWAEWYYKTPVKGKLPSDSAKYRYESAYKHYTKDLHGMIFSEIRPMQLQKCIDECPKGKVTQESINVLFHHLYKYAIKMEIVSVDASSAMTVTKSSDPKRNPFSREEVRAMWASPRTPCRDAMLILIYTGMRPGELFRNVDASTIDQGYIHAGLKTKQSINRAIPIHPAIADIARDFFAAQAYRYPRLMYDIREQFPGHKPHDGRRTFSRRAHECEMADIAVRKIMGHKGRDVHEKVYSDISIEYLMDEIQRLEY